MNTSAKGCFLFGFITVVGIVKNRTVLSVFIVLQYYKQKGEKEEGTPVDNSNLHVRSSVTLNNLINKG